MKRVAPATLRARTTSPPAERAILRVSGRPSPALALVLKPGVKACSTGAVAVGGDAVVVVGRTFPAVALRSAVSHARCVTADSVGALVQLDVFGRDLRRGCPVVLDTGGLTHDRDALVRAGLQVPRRYDAAWQRDMRSYLLSRRAVLVRRGLDGFDRLTRRDIRRAGVVMTDGPYRVFGSTGCHPGHRRATHRPRPKHAHATGSRAAPSTTTCHRG